MFFMLLLTVVRCSSWFLW